MNKNLTYFLYVCGSFVTIFGVMGFIFKVIMIGR